MTSLVLLPSAGARRFPWKNGRGTTEEIGIGPRGASFEAGDFDWRVSRAAVDRAGPFSTFPGVDRVIVVLEGEGLRLVHGDAGPVEVRPLAPHGFPGDVPTIATLLGGPVRDFNVLARRGRTRADVRLVRAGASPAHLALPEGTALLYAARGVAVVTAEGRTVSLAPGDALLREDGMPGEATVASPTDSAATGEAVVLLVAIRAVAGAAGTAPRT